MKALSNTQRLKGFTLVELLVVIGIIAVMISILLPTLGRVRESALRTKCTSNLRQLHNALQLYANANRGYLPPKYELRKMTLNAADIAAQKRLNQLNEGMQTVLERYLTSKEAWRCPADCGHAQSGEEVFKLRGSSYNVTGFPWGGPSASASAVSQKRSMKLTLNYNRDLGGDCFKPWDSDDPANVQAKIAAGEMGPVKWHKKFYNMLLGDGHVMSFQSKSDYQDAEKGYSGTN
jgi:prepilin-type N-terminal cleavage/methylation domain-containing protein